MNKPAPATRRRPRRRRRSPQEIRERLLSATREAFRESGYGATTAEIAASADVTEGQLYRYFPSKIDLLREAVYRPLNSDLAQFSTDYLSEISSVQDSKERIRLYINRLQDFVKNRPEFIAALTAAPSSPKAEIVPVAELDSLLTYFDLGAVMLESREGANPNIAPRLMARIIFGTVLSGFAFGDWLFPDGGPESEEEVEGIGEFLVGGVYANLSSGKHRKPPGNSG